VEGELVGLRENVVHIAATAVRRRVAGGGRSRDPHGGSLWVDVTGQ